MGVESASGELCGSIACAVGYSVQRARVPRQCWSRVGPRDTWWPQNCEGVGASRSQSQNLVVDSSRGAGIGGPGGGGAVCGTPAQASWAWEGHGGSSDCPSSSLQAAKLEEVVSREPLKSAGDGNQMVGLPGWGLHSSLASWPSRPLSVWPGEETGCRADSRAKSCVGYEVAPEVAENS